MGRQAILEAAGRGWRLDLREHGGAKAGGGQKHGSGGRSGGDDIEEPGRARQMVPLVVSISLKSQLNRTELNHLYKIENIGQLAQSMPRAAVAEAGNGSQQARY
jgi:hypothetical protein